MSVNVQPIAVILINMLNESDERDELLKQDREPDTLLSGEEKEVSVLFIHLYGFERLAEQMDVEPRVEFFNYYFESMVEAIFECQGTLDKYIGSTIMAVFGSPLPLENHALMAIKAALQMREQLPGINRHWFPNEPQPLTIGIGINTDQIFQGYVGTPQAAEFTAVGHGVNVANHLSQQAQHYGCDILIGQKTYESSAASIQARDRGLTQLTPEGTPVKVYELIGLHT